MKTLDVFSRRFLSVSIGLTMIFLSISLLIFSLKSLPVAHAGPSDDDRQDLNKFSGSYPVVVSDTVINVDDVEGEIRAMQAFGIGIREGNLYFGILYNNNSIGLHKAPADSEDVLDW